jgi:hypothetical protein
LLVIRFKNPYNWSFSNLTILLDGEVKLFPEPVYAPAMLLISISSK